jgi:DNA-binding SARP family transcriptional activator
MNSAGLGFGLLGPLTLTAGGTPLPLGTPKQRALLAMMLINRNRIVGTDSLINAMWGEEPVPAVRASIPTYVSNVRRLLHTAGANSQDVLSATSPGYRLSVPCGDCDLDRFITKKNAGIDLAATGRFEESSHSFVGSSGRMAWVSPR